ncbi:LuxR C-terminal-related transcriptional regulator [Kribbella sp. NPDC050124]|uniref:LuxR C-terminal-related transcriptional regulator n=1 Tax=Kribbella sp. NPDC050124 TaxID=3364114 RepID=UPI0037AEBB37
MPSDQHEGVGSRQRTSPDAPSGRLAATTMASVIPRGTVPRPRLVDRLDLGVQRPLTLISAPAGFGKTILVQSWAQQYQGSAVVRRIALAAGSEPADVLDHVRHGPHRSGQQALVLVVDCGDLTITPEIGQSLHRLIRGDAGRVRVVLVTRSDPPLPLHLYRLADTIAEIHAADLAFTVDETTALMRTFKLDLTDAQVAEIRARTDGWPVGLMFAAMNLAGKSDPEQVIREFRGDTGNVAAYLMTEVLDAQPPELRKFLLRTSLVEVVRPGLAEALTGRPCDLRSLQFLSHGNSFIQPVPGTADCYSYQPLFREFLRAEMLFEMPAVATTLHRAAAAWFARNGQPLEAIHHAVTAGDWSHAAQYLVADLDCAALLVGHGSRQLTSLFAEFPDDLEGPEAAVVRATLELGEFEVDRSTSELAKARTWLDHEVSARSQAVELAIGVLQAVCASLDGDTETGLSVVLAAETRLRAAAPDSAVAHPEARLLIVGCKGRALLRRGDFPAALDAFNEGIAIAENSGAHEALAEFLGMAALVEAIRGRLRRAGEVVAQATALAESGAQPDLPQATLVAEAWMRTDQGDLPGAEDLVHRAAEAAVPTHDTRVVAAALALVRARLLRAGGDLDLAAAELRAARGSYGSQGGWLSQALIVDQAKLLVSQHLPQEAIRVIEQSEGRDQAASLLVLQRAAAEAGQRPPAQSRVATDRTEPLEIQVDGWLVQAAESISAGNTGRGGLCLERALRMAAPEQLRRPFTEAPPSLRTLLQPSGDLMRQHPWLRGPSHRGRGRAADRWGVPRSELVITTSLTSKEQEVLEYLAELLTTEEIAGTMYVSVNTVRSHVRSILRKLGASRRNEAVRRAWELGLLPSRPEG